MRYLFIVLIITFSTAIAAQELIEFENGQVADADDINSNFQELLDTIKLQQETIDALDARILALEPNEFTTTYDGWLLGDAVVGNDGLTVSANFYRATGSAFVSQPVSSGKHYWEIRASCGPDQFGSNMGVVGGSYDELPSYLENDSQTSWYIVITDGARIREKGGAPITLNDGRLNTVANDIFQIALDLDNNQIYFGKNGIWLGDADPISQQNPAFSIDNKTYYAKFEAGAEQCVPHAMTTNFGASDFAYSVPSGYFKGYCPTSDCEVAD